MQILNYLFEKIKKQAPSIEEQFHEITLPEAHDIADLLEKLPSSDCFKKACAFFAQYPETALLVRVSRALLYFIVCYIKPDHALEIGTYKAGSSEILSRALYRNGKGKLITIDPFGQERVPPILESWSENLRKHVSYMPCSSMDCFIYAGLNKIFFDFVFVDGDHSYEYALFDLQMAARYAQPGGIIVMDNADQAGVYLAVRKFLDAYPNWHELGSSIAEYDPADPFTSMKPSFPQSSFLILQESKQIIITDCCRSFVTPQMVERGLSGFELSLNGLQEDGIMHVCIFSRSFWHTGFSGEAEEKKTIKALPINKGELSCHIQLDKPFITEHVPENSFRTFEIILSWSTLNRINTSIILTKQPIPITIS